MSIQWKQLREKFQKKHFSIRFTLYFLFGYLLYCLTLGVIVPPIAKSQIPSQLSSILGREVSLHDISVNPFLLNLKLNQFAVLDKAGSDTFLGFEELDVQVNFWQSLANMAIAVEHIKLKRPFGHIERLSEVPTTFNFSDIVDNLDRQFPANSEIDTQEKPESSILSIMISAIHLQQGNITFIDNVTQGELRYPDTNVRITSLNTLAEIRQPEFETANSFQIDVKGQNQDTVQLNGQFQIVPLMVMGDVTISKFDLPTAWQFIAQAFEAKLTQGKLNVRSDYQLKVSDNNPLQLTTNKGEVSIENLHIMADSRPVVTLPRFNIEGINSNLEKELVTIARVYSTDLVLNSRVDQSGLDLITFFTPTLSDKTAVENLTAEPQKESGEANWQLSLDKLELDNYQLNIKEKVVTDNELDWSLQSLNLTTSQLVSDLSQPFDLQLSASLNQKGNIAINGVVDPKKESADAHVDVSSLQLSQFQPYVATAINATIKRGDFNTQVTVKADASGEVKVNGALQIDKLAVKDNLLNKSLIKWQQLQIDNFDFDLIKSTLALNTLLLKQPYATVIIAENKETNISQLLVEQGETASKATEQTSNPFAVTVNRIEIDQGSAFFADNSMTPNFSTGIESLEGAVTHISSRPGTKATVDMKGNIDRYAPVSIKGEINPLIENPFVDLSLDFNSVELTSVNPYSGTYAGYYIDRGQLSVTLQYLLEENQLTGSNHVVIDQLELGQASDSDLATSLPLTLAIALLQDGNGVIDLGVEVTGDVDDPDFSIGSVILNAIANVITKAVTAPFSLLAGLADSDAELNHIEFAFGDAELSEEQQQKLIQLGEALSSRPKLKLTVDGAVNAQEDSKVLAVNQLHQKLIMQAKLDESEIPVQLTASSISEYPELVGALKALYQTELSSKAAEVKSEIIKEQQEKQVELTNDDLATRWHIAMYNQLLNHQQISDDELGQLAHQRAKNVKSFLIETVQVAAGRVFLLDSRFDIEQDDSGVVLTLEAN